MNKINLFLIVCLAFVFNACDDFGETKQYFQLGNKTSNKVIVEYQYSENELRIIKVPANGSSVVWYVTYSLPDYTPESSSIERELNKMTIYQVIGTDTTYLPKDEYISADKWIRSTSYDMSTTFAYYTLTVDSTMFTN